MTLIKCTSILGCSMPRKGSQTWPCLVEDHVQKSSHSSSNLGFELVQNDNNSQIFSESQSGNLVGEHFFFDTSDRRRNRKNMRSARDLRLLASVHRVLNTGLIDISEIFRNILRQKKSQNLNCFSCLIWMAPFGFNMIQRVHLQQILASHRKRLSHRVIVKHGSTRDEFTMNSGGESTRINASKSATPRNKEFQHPKMREKWDDVTPWAILTWPRLCRPSFLLP